MNIHSLFEKVTGDVLPRYNQYDWPNNRNDESPNPEDLFSDLFGDVEPKRLDPLEISSLGDQLRQDQRPESPHRSLIIGGSRELGMEICAFYKSKRFEHTVPFPGCWGIFYISDAIDVIADELSKFYPARPISKKLAYEFIRSHEIEHFKCDLRTIYLELINQTALYEPLRYQLRAHRLCSSFVEEAIANRAAFNWAKKPANNIADFARHFMDAQPGAYSRYAERPIALKSEWYSTLLNGTAPGDRRPYFYRDDLASWWPGLPINTRLDDCPEFIIKLSRYSHRLISHFELPRINSIKATSNFQKKLEKWWHLKQPWQDTVARLTSDPNLTSLGFKRFKKAGKKVWSVNVLNTSGFRAHLTQTEGREFEAFDIGPHKAMGHG